jgi:hypothetical protein
MSRRTLSFARSACLVSAGLFSAALVAACSGATTTNTFGGGGGESSSNTSGAGNGQPSSTTGTADIATVGIGAGGGLLAGAGGGLTSDTSATSGAGVGGGCAGIHTDAQTIPLDMYIMLDQSQSMTQAAGTTTKWDAVTTALTSFVQQGAAVAGIGVGIQFFGLPPNAGGGGPTCTVKHCVVDTDCGPAACGPCNANGRCTGYTNNGGGVAKDSCTSADYATAAVEIAPLPGVATAITQSYANITPHTSTPTAPALQGAIDHAKTWENAHTDHVTVVVFATDGEPEECTPFNNQAAIGSPTDPPGTYTDATTYTAQSIASIAAYGAQGTPKILTFVIGVGNSVTSLNTIAAAGGTTKAFIVDTAGDANKQFLDALNAIRGTALSCSYEIPKATGSTPVDLNKVNVEYTPGNGGAPVEIGNVPDKASCPANGNGWYYDNPTTPTQIVMCDSTCTTLKGDAKGQVSIVLGCATVVIPK